MSERERFSNLPIKDRQALDEVGLILRKNIKFKWEGEQSWVGLTREDLVELIIQIAVFIGITANQAKKIEIIFADDYALSGMTPCVGRAISHSKNGLITKCTVILNRSVKVLEDDLTQVESERGADIDRLEALGLFDSDQEALIYNTNPVERTVWTMAEELHHSHFALVAGSVERWTTWEERYIRQLKNSENLMLDGYDIDLTEVAASRVVLRTLTYLFNKDYFRQCYLKSLERRRAFLALTPNSAFVNTGHRSSLLTVAGQVIRSLFNGS
jgi:hypothetical protein